MAQSGRIIWPHRPSITAICTKVAAIGKKAFFKCKRLSSLTIKTKLLESGSVGGSAFAGLHSGVKVKCPPDRKNLYNKLLTKAGLPESAVWK